MKTSRRTSAFPSTAHSWIESRLGDPEGAAAIHRHLMTVYAEPLAVYVRGTPYRTLGDPLDLVHGFFADRLAREGFLDAWRASGLLLRRWLMNGISFYLKETARQRRRHVASELPEEVPQRGPAVEEEVDRAFALSVVRAALEEARSDCAARGLAEHFDVFYDHHALDRPYATIVAGRDLTEERARVMARTARQAFRGALRRTLAWDGNHVGGIEREIENLLEVLE